jgi:hypothetical protein
MAGNQSVRFDLAKVSRIYLLSLSILGFCCLIWLFAIPSEAKGISLFGYSLFRLLLAMLLSVPVILFFIFGLKTNQSSRWLKWLAATMKAPKWVLVFNILTLAIIFTCVTFIIFFPFYKSGQYLAHYERLLPVCIWSLIFGLANPIFFNHVITSGEKKPDKSWNGFLVPTLIILGFFILVWLVIVTTGLGMTQDPSYWDTQLPVPLLEGQIYVAWWSLVLLMTIAMIFNRSGSQKKFKRGEKWLDILLVVVIWLIAFNFWMTQPIPNTYFTPKVRPPNNEVYPYSDARIYDSDAQGVLLGEVGYSGRIVRRPLFVLFLAGLHALIGPGYEKLIQLQTVFLAGIPVVLYLIGKHLGGRSSGMLLATFSILIEFNTLRVASLITTSNSKLLMTELPPLLIIAILILCLMYWAGQPARYAAMPLVVGGILGAAVFLRSQSLLLYPFIVLVFLLILWKKWKHCIQAILLCALGLVLVITPWLVRNLFISGQFAFEDPTYTQAVIQRFQVEREGLGELSSVEEEVDLFGGAIQYIIQNPTQFIGFVANNYLHNEWLNLFVLPIRGSGVEGLSDLLNPVNLFWIKQEKSLNVSQSIVILVYLVIIALGMGVAFHRFRIVGLIPLIIHIGFNISSAFSRISGWRFILPVQWVMLLYFSIGLVQIVTWLLHFIGMKRIEPFTGSSTVQGEKGNGVPINYLKNKPFILWLLVILCLGLLIPGVMHAIPLRYERQDRETLKEELLSLPSWDALPQVKSEYSILLDDERIHIHKGLAYYPRFYRAYDGEPSRVAGIYRSLPYPRLIFLLIGKARQDVLLAMLKPPEYFPNAVEVITVEKETDQGNDTLLVALTGDRSRIYFKEYSPSIWD